MRETVRSALVLPAMLALSCVAACGNVESPLAQDTISAGRLDEADLEQGRRLIAEKGCVACHVVPQVRSPVSTVGPPLNNIRTQAYLSGLLPNTPANLVQWLLNPPAINPRTAMPNVGLSQAQAEDIAAFLMSLP